MSTRTTSKEASTPRDSAPQIREFSDLAQRCKDLSAFVALARGRLSATTQRTLTDWVPGQPVLDGQRSAVTELAALHLESCGLDAAIALTDSLVRFPTVSAREPAATGPAFVGMAQFLERWAKDAGLDFATFGANDVWVIGLGRGPESVGYVMHADVVPVDEAPTRAPSGEGPPMLPPGWSHPPFEVTQVDGRLYGRGTEDDKGPIAAVLVALQTFAKFGLEPHGRITAIIGTGEEHDWTGMSTFAQRSTHPRYVISLDAGFPVVIAESGFVSWTLGIPRALNSSTPKGCVKVEDARGGQFLTQVPGEATAHFSPEGTGSLDSVRRAVEAAVEAEQTRGFTYRIETISGRIELHVSGKAVHSSTAQEGKNALWGLARVASRLNTCESGPMQALALLHRFFDGDHHGERLGIAHAHEVMGKLLVAPTVLRSSEDEVTLAVNMRRPEGPSAEDFGRLLDGALLRIQKELTPKWRELPERRVGRPALVDPSGPLVSTLLGVYRELTHSPQAEPIAIRGGTYARLFPGAVSFGPSLPGRSYRGHAPDEYLEVEALQFMLRAIWASATRLDAAAATPENR